MNREPDDMPEALGWCVCDVVTAATLVGVIAAIFKGWI